MKVKNLGKWSETDVMNESGTDRIVVGLPSKQEMEQKVKDLSRERQLKVSHSCSFLDQDVH